ncbi:putative cytochrome P450 [Hypomontagnella monticulosa]|nr:putative cytochrome P450 [Hypomontagnella monticulosa]
MEAVLRFMSASLEEARRNQCTWVAYSCSPSYLLVSVLFICFSIVLHFINSRTSKAYYPIVQGLPPTLSLAKIYARWNWFKNGPKLIRDAYEKHGNTICQLPAPEASRGLIVLPARFLEEIKSLPVSVASNNQAHASVFAGTWTSFNAKILCPTTMKAIKAQYISKLGQQTGAISDETKYAVGERFSSYKDWTPIAAQPRLMEIITQVVSRTIAGPEICRQPIWIKSAIGYTEGVMKVAYYMRLVPRVMEPLIAIFTPYLYRVYWCRNNIRNIISPVIRDRLTYRDQQPDLWSARLKDGTADNVDWLIASSSPDEATPKLITHRLIVSIFGANHIVPSYIFNCLLELAADFDRWAPPLRDEIEGILGSNAGAITKAHLSQMWKLDSFIKEEQRFHHISQLSMYRVLCQPYKLSSGDILPKGAMITLASTPMSMSEEYYSDPNTFDGFRFERLRRDPHTAHGGLEFGSSFAGSLHFGYGMQACPGRMMASALCKLVLIEILLRYDMRLQRGEKRPENIMFFESDYPDPAYEILFRDRESK